MDDLIEKVTDAKPKELIHRYNLYSDMLAVIPKLLNAIEIAIERSDLESGDTFGIHHNDVMDVISEAEAIIAKAKGVK
jgi:hypothetical protein